MLKIIFSYDLFVFLSDVNVGLEFTADRNAVYDTPVRTLSIWINALRPGSTVFILRTRLVGS